MFEKVKENKLLTEIEISHPLVQLLTKVGRTACSCYTDSSCTLHETEYLDCLCQLEALQGRDCQCQQGHHRNTYDDGGGNGCRLVHRGTAIVAAGVELVVTCRTGGTSHRFITRST